MKKILLAIGFLFALAAGAKAQTNCVELREIDGTPDVKCVKVIKVTNGTLACTGSTCTLTISGGGGGSPGGSDTNVQYNDSGSFGGVAGFVFDKTSKISLGVAGTSVGAIAFRNATSGTITLQPVTGALGTVTLSLPAATGTLLYGGGPLGTPSSGTATNITGLPISTGVSGLGTGVATFLATPSSANFLSAITDETGSGLVMGNNTPTIITPSFTTGFTIGGVAATGTIPRGNGTNFIASTFTMAAPGTSGNVLTSDGTNWVSSAPAGGGITVGTTTITGGTGGRLPYNNAGVYGEISTLTSDGTIVTFAPTVTTGTGASSGVVMAANSLTTGTGFNISSSSVTSGSLVNIASTSTAAASSTLKALNIAVSGANGTTAQTVTGAAISVTNTNATSGTNVALTLTASGATTANTALNVTAGQILTAVNGALSTGNGPAILATGTWITGGSATTTKPYVLIETTGATSTGWNTSGTGLGINAATGFAGNLLDLQVNGISKSKFTSTGALNINSTGASFGDDVAIYAGTTSTLNSRVAVIGNNATGLRMSSSYAVQWSANAATGGDANSSIDLTLRRAAAANLAFGAADAASPVAQTLSVQNVVAGTSNTAGVDWTFKGSAGTGTGAGGKLIFQTAPAGSSGTSQNSFVTGMTLQSDGVVVYKSVTFANLPTVVNGGIIYCSDCTLASPCASGGSGALAKGINSAWVCN